MRAAAKKNKNPPNMNPPPPPSSSSSAVNLFHSNPTATLDLGALYASPTPQQRQMHRQHSAFLAQAGLQPQPLQQQQQQQQQQQVLS